MAAAPGRCARSARVSAGQHPGAHARVHRPRLLGHGFHAERSLAVPQLTYVEVVRPAVESDRHVVPPEQDVAERLHEAMDGGELIEDAEAIQKVGAFSLLVEAVPPEVCRIIRDELTISVYSIGAGIDADGQLMIVSNVLGIFQAFTAKFVKKYANLGEETLNALSAYVDDVRAGRFPEPQHTYNMVEGELPKLMVALKK